MEEITKDIDILQKTPGQILRVTRENNGISIAEVSQVLLLNKSIINALEADDYSGIVARVYAEGYLKSYAAYLKLPISAILESFRHLNAYGKSEIKPVRMIKNNTKANDGAKSVDELFLSLKNKKSIMLLAIFAGLVCLVLVVVVIKYVLVKVPQESILPINNATVVSAFPITVSSDLVSVPQAEQVETPKDNKKTKKNKPEPEPELLDEDSEDLNDDVAQ